MPEEARFRWDDSARKSVRWSGKPPTAPGAGSAADARVRRGTVTATNKWAPQVKRKKAYLDHRTKVLLWWTSAHTCLCHVARKRRRMKEDEEDEEDKEGEKDEEDVWHLCMVHVSNSTKISDTVRSCAQVVEILLQGVNLAQIICLRFRGDEREYKPVYQTNNELRFHVVFLPTPCSSSSFKVHSFTFSLLLWLGWWGLLPTSISNLSSVVGWRRPFRCSPWNRHRAVSAAVPAFRESVWKQHTSSTLCIKPRVTRVC